MATIPHHLTAAEAAECLGVHVSQISRYISAGLLPCRRFGRTGRQYLIPAGALRRFRRPPVGNPNLLRGLPPNGGNSKKKSKTPR